MVLSKYELGKLVKEARKIKSEKIGRRYTQVMLASDIKASQGYIGDIESGRTYPTFRVISKIAYACEVPLNFFSGTKFDILKRIITNYFPDLSQEEIQEFSTYVLTKIDAALDDAMDNDVDSILNFNSLKLMYDEHKQQKNTCTPACKNKELPLSSSEDASNYIFIARSEITDAKAAMDLILSQHDLMLNGEILYDESKIALVNAVQLGLKNAELIQRIGRVSRLHEK